MGVPFSGNAAATIGTLNSEEVSQIMAEQVPLDGKKQSPVTHKVQEGQHATGERLVTGQPVLDKADAKPQAPAPGAPPTMGE